MAAKSKFMSFMADQDVVVQPGRPESRDVNNRVVSKAVPSIHATFKDHYFSTDDGDVVKFLKDSELYQQPRGIWLEGDAPDEPKPTRTDQQKQIASAAAKQDIPKLQAVLEEERATHNRPDVIAAGETAISEIQVPAVEEAAALVRQDEPAERTGVPRVDPSERDRINPEVDRERIIKSEEVAQARAEVVGDDAAVEKKHAAEAEAAADGETDPKKIAKAGTTETKPKSEGAAKSSKSTAKGKSSGANARSTKG